MRIQAQGLSTFFDSIGNPTGDCKMPTNDLKDSSEKSLPFVALNTNKASGVREDRQVRAGSWLCHGHLKLASPVLCFFAC